MSGARGARGDVWRFVFGLLMCLFFAVFLLFVAFVVLMIIGIGA